MTYRRCENDSAYLLRMNLSFFADDASQEEKTEQPTQKKKDKSREEGQVLKSAEIGTAVLFISAFFTLRIIAPWLYNKLGSLITASMIILKDFDQLYEDDYIKRYLLNMFLQSFIVAAPLLFVTLVMGFLVQLYQVKWKPTAKPLTPKFSKLNPIKGLKRLFSLGKLVELGKSLIKLAIIGITIYSMITSNMHAIFAFVDMSVMNSLQFVGNMIVDMGIRVGMLYIAIAAVDYLFQKYKFDKEQKMTKQEVKDEWKQAEGDPHIKGKIKQKMREASMRRMMQEVPNADVIITNPTHFAVAIKYDRAKGLAPFVVAKGADFLAKRIKDKAKESKVEIVENKQLARVLYNTVDVGKEIPPELYQAVAEVLAFVYKLRGVS
ncbi:flagellar biosynthetic protein FlhB [Clostridia bacterium]|nr:flagellar biosynthetic protein FlhB [Clostridia bacterium]